MSVESLINNALAIAEARRKIVGEMRSALLSKDDRKVIELAAKLCGVKINDQGNWPDSRID